MVMIIVMKVKIEANKTMVLTVMLSMNRIMTTAPSLSLKTYLLTYVFVRLFVYLNALTLILFCACVEGVVLRVSEWLTVN